MQILAQLALVVPAADPVPADNDVVAGWLGAVVFLALIAAVALLGWSMSRHLRKVHQNNEAGVYGPPDEPKRQSS